MFQDQEVFLTDSGIIIGEIFIFHNNVKSGHLHVGKIAENHPCTFSKCDIFCLAKSATEYSCECPDTMKFSTKYHRCMCEDTPNCTHCGINEFFCDNSRCLSLNVRCNAIDDCGDGSDEFGCIISCEQEFINCKIDNTCITLEKVCNGISDCSDMSDEENCDKHTAGPYTYCKWYSRVNEGYFNIVNNGIHQNIGRLCRPVCSVYQFHCKDGNCIDSRKVCDQKFDCDDMSDEHGCTFKILEISKLSCPIGCDGICLALDKLCDHITDCSDGRDEISCEHKYNCLASSQLKCKSDPLCLDIDVACDGFVDCSDGSDEQECKYKNICEQLDVFVCDSGTECIDMNKYCDNIEDCQDKSDETIDCIKNTNIISLEKFYLSANSVKFKWRITNYAQYIFFNVTLISTDQKVKYSKITRTYELTIQGFEECSRYKLVVKILGITHGRKSEFTYHKNKIPIPYNLEYNKLNRTIFWSYKNSKCRPVSYYVYCKINHQNFIKTFTAENFLTLKEKKLEYCEIAACLLDAYNVSCSTFIRYKHKKWDTFIILIIFAIAILLILLPFYIDFVIIFKSKIKYHIHYSSIIVDEEEALREI